MVSRFGRLELSQSGQMVEDNRQQSFYREETFPSTALNIYQTTNVKQVLKPELV
jgi:hypothetical protein